MEKLIFVETAHRIYGKRMTFKFSSESFSKKRKKSTGHSDYGIRKTSATQGHESLKNISKTHASTKNCQTQR